MPVIHQSLPPRIAAAKPPRRGRQRLTADGPCPTGADAAFRTASVQAASGDAGIVAQCSFGAQFVLAEAEAASCLTVRVARFRRPEFANRSIDESIARLLGDPFPYDGIKLIAAADLPRYGDHSTGYFYAYSVPDEGMSDGIALLFRKGCVLYELELEGSAASDRRVIDAVVQDILTCARNGHERLVAIPDALAEYIDAREVTG